MRWLAVCGSAVATIIWSSASVGSSNDWPMFRFNAERHGYTPEELPAKLAQAWVFHAPPPRPAWPLGSGRAGNGPSPLEFDKVHQPIAAGGLVFFGSSADGKLYALDAATGVERWGFYAGGPIRFAPAAWRDRVFAGSDDGWLYCLEQKTGKLLWKRRGGPSEEKVLGNDFVVSRWPIRGGVVVKDDTVYFGVGCWPIDLAYLHALDAATGKERWTSITGGPIPDKKEWAGGNRGFAAQSYIAASGKRLLMANGHTQPALFDRATGVLLGLANVTGDGAVVVDDEAAALGGGFVMPETGALIRGMDSRCFLPIYTTVVSGRIFGLAGGRICEIDRKALQPLAGGDAKKKGYSIGEGIASYKAGAGEFAIIAAGSRLYTGGKGKVQAVDIQGKSLVWSATVDGDARGLAAAGGRLFVSTTEGHVYGFASDVSGAAQTVTPKREDAAEDPAWGMAADEILQKAGIKEGYCADLGCGDGRLALALARRSQLTIVALEKDPEKAAAARRRLDGAGVYGARVMVIEADPAASGLPKWFANMVVSGRSVEEGDGAVAAAEAARIQRPYGGVSVFGKTAAMKKNIRGPVEGSGNWTHFLADAANSDCSDDTALKAPLRSYWYKACDSGGAIPHVIGCPPLFVDGRLYTMYLSGVRAVDPYNGRFLWQHQLKEMFPFYPVSIPASMRYGYMCADEKSVYVRLPSKIVRIDGATGAEMKAYEPPPPAARTTNVWSHVAYDAGTLYAAAGSRYAVPVANRTEPTSAHPEAGAMTALDPETGRTKWMYKAESSIPISSIVIGGGRVYFLDRPFLDSAAWRRPVALKPVGEDAGAGDEEDDQQPPVAATNAGEVVALDGATGRVLWKQPAGGLAGPVMALSVEHGVLVRSYHCRSKNPQTGNGPLVAMRCSNGEVLWKIDKEAHGSYPMIIGDTLHTLPNARDLLTGKERTDSRTGKRWAFIRTLGHHCGDYAASRNVITFRSSSLSYIDLLDFRGVEEFFGNVRPGCQINAVPAGGLLIMPEGAPCGCPYNKAWVALQGAE